VTGALAGLDAADVVLGPAEDGGYYLIALREPRPELFQGIDWSTAAVLQQTRSRATSARLSVLELEPLRDLDTLDDLRAEWPAVKNLLAHRPELCDTLARALGTSPST
jgi:glycosyltransferase A (GT-A) superfamily protein (DUF2064 family)